MATSSLSPEPKAGDQKIYFTYSVAKEDCELSILTIRALRHGFLWRSIYFNAYVRTTDWFHDRLGLLMSTPASLLEYKRSRAGKLI